MVLSTWKGLSKVWTLIACISALVWAAPFHAALAESAPNLGAAGSFAVLAGTTVTCTGGIIIGDVGVNLGGSVGACTVLGEVHVGDTVAQQAYADFLAAYAALAPVPCGYVLTGSLAGETLSPGVYCFGATAALAGVLTLDGPSNGIWIFKIGTSGTGALESNSSSVVMTGGGGTCNSNARVFWWTAQSATLTDSDFIGSILAGTNITDTRGSLNGQALAKEAVTLTGPSVSWPAILLTPAYLPSAPAFAAYSQTVTAGNGAEPYVYSVASGSLPTGLALDPSTGEISGVPTEGGIFNFVLLALDGNECTGSQSYSIEVTCAGLPPVISGSVGGCVAPGILLSTGLFGSYQWILNGADIAGATSRTYAATASGTYRVRADDCLGATGTSADFPVIAQDNPVSEVSPSNSVFPLRLTRNMSSPIGFTLYFQRLGTPECYNFYEGTVGSWYSHAGAGGNVCNMAVTDLGTGEMRAAITPSEGNHYYLITTYAGIQEGPSGFASNGVEIPAGQSTCVP